MGELLHDYAIAKADLESFLGINGAEFRELCEAWPQLEEELFAREQSVDGFYMAWDGNVGRANLCANLHNQFTSTGLYSAAGQRIAKARRVLDYGCGTGAITFAHGLRRNRTAELVFVELQELVRRFIQFRVEQHKLPDARVCSPCSLADERPFDLVLCIDVLEHLENPSYVLIECLLPRVSLDGLLILRAPWRGQLTHIDAAPRNFYSQGGREALASHFVTVERIGPNDVDAVYRRIN